jgi:hypothetical protein
MIKARERLGEVARAVMEDFSWEDPRDVTRGSKALHISVGREQEGKSVRIPALSIECVGLSEPLVDSGVGDGWGREIVGGEPEV